VPPPIVVTPATDMRQMTLVNLGCGRRFRSGWLNFDFVSHSPDVTAANLLRPLPLADGAADFVYTSHVVEHFTRSDAVELLRECRRILSPQGTIRVSVPDLEFLARDYLRSVAENSHDPARHIWFISELIDQMAREESGGEKKSLIAAGDAEYRGWIRSFANTEISNLIDATSQKKSGSMRQHVRDILKQLTPPWVRVGRFRMSGEPHKWMYDRITLPQLLRTTGFHNIQERSFSTSVLPNWKNYSLDNEVDHEYKPGSIYFEANKFE